MTPGTPRDGRSTVLYGLAAEQVAHIWAAVIVEAAGIGVLIPGLHLVIEAGDR